MTACGEVKPATQAPAPRRAAPPRLTDSHVHLDRYSDAEVAAMLAAAEAAGLERILAVSVDRSSAQRTVALARRYPLLRAAVGLHPLRCQGESASTFLALRRLAGSEPLVRAVSEVGLDFSLGSPPASAQEDAFRLALRLAREVGLPVFVHAVAADDAVLRLLAEDGADVLATIHYFTGDWERAQRFLEAGCRLSFGKPVTRAANAALREAARRTPLDRLLVETDSYPLPGRTTQPRDVREVVTALAELKQLSVEAVATASAQNLAALLQQ